MLWMVCVAVKLRKYCIYYYVFMYFIKQCIGYEIIIGLLHHSLLRMTAGSYS